MSSISSESLLSSSTYFKYANSSWFDCWNNRREETCAKNVSRRLNDILLGLGSLLAGCVVWGGGKVIRTLSSRCFKKKVFSKVIPHIPSQREIYRLSINELHAIWRANNQALIGAIHAKGSLPKFGFHGTSNGENILKTRCSKGYLDEIYVAGYTLQLDPITFLADLYTIAQKASTYGEDVLVVLTDEASYEKQIRTYPESLLFVDELDSQEEREILKYTCRNGSDEETTFCSTEEDILNIHKTNTVASRCFYPIAELKLSFDESTFN